MRKNILIAVALLLFIANPTISQSTIINSWEEEKPNLPAMEPLAKTPTCPVIKFPANAVIFLGFKGTESRFDITVKEIDETQGSDIKKGVTYRGHCANRSSDIEKNQEHKVWLFPSCDREAMPSEIREIPWEKINYILNHRKNTEPDQVQEAFWYYTNPEKRKKLSEEAASLIAEADKNANFIPGKDDKVAVILYTGYKQLLFIELNVPEKMEEVALPPAAPAAPAAVGGWFPLIPIIPIIPGGGGNHPTPPPPHQTPEPSTLLLLGSGIAALVFFRAKRKGGA